MDTEVWKPIKGYEGWYEVSSLGNVRSIAVRRSIWGKVHVINRIRNMSLIMGSQGYLRVVLSNNKDKKCVYVHRLVAEAFIPNPKEYPQVNHKDENKCNNCVENLEWCDEKYNSNYGTGRDRMSKALKERYATMGHPWEGRKHSEDTKRKIRDNHVGRQVGKDNPNHKPVYCVELDRTFWGAKEAHDVLGVNAECICKCCKGKRETSGGYHWMYEKDRSK